MFALHWGHRHRLDRVALAAQRANEAVGTDVESEAPPAEESEATPADAGAADPESEAPAADAESDAAAPAADRTTTNRFKVGDVVMGIATKHKDSWHNRKAKIIGVLTSHYKVRMLEGPSNGLLHRYVFKDCVLVDPHVAAATGAASSAATSAASSADSRVASAVAATSAVETPAQPPAQSQPPSQPQALTVTEASVWEDFQFPPCSSTTIIEG